MMTVESLSDRALETALVRAAHFILGVNGNALVRTLLAPRGLTDAEIVKGRGFIDAVLEAQVPSAQKAVTLESLAAQGAVAQLDSLDERVVGETGAILANGHEGARGYLLNELTPASGVDSVLVVQKFCRRYRALQTGSDPDRAATLEADTAAIERLSERGYGEGAIAELEGLVNAAFGPTPELPSAGDIDAAIAARRENLIVLRKWYDEWATTARYTLTKKSHLMELGLANRKSPKPKPVAEPIS